MQSPGKPLYENITCLAPCDPESPSGQAAATPVQTETTRDLLAGWYGLRLNGHCFTFLPIVV